MTSHKLITFTDWASGEPADFLNQDCLDIKGSVHYHWNDSPCSYLHWFICEKHVYVLQLLTLIIVRVLYLKLKKKKYIAYPLQVFVISSKIHERSSAFVSMQVISRILTINIDRRLKKMVLATSYWDTIINYISKWCFCVYLNFLYYDVFFYLHLRQLRSPGA